MATVATGRCQSSVHPRRLEVRSVSRRPGGHHVGVHDRVAPLRYLDGCRTPWSAGDRSDLSGHQPRRMALVRTIYPRDDPIYRGSS